MIGVVAAMAIALPGAAQGGAGVRHGHGHGQGDVACRHQSKSCTTDWLI